MFRSPIGTTRSESDGTFSPPRSSPPRSRLPVLVDYFTMDVRIYSAHPPSQASVRHRSLWRCFRIPPPLNDVYPQLYQSTALTHDDRGESDPPRIKAHPDTRCSAEGWAVPQHPRYCALLFPPRLEPELTWAPPDTHVLSQNETVSFAV